MHEARRAAEVVGVPAAGRGRLRAAELDRLRLSAHPFANGSSLGPTWIGWAVVGRHGDRRRVWRTCCTRGWPSWPDALRRKRFLVLTVVMNLTFLGFFKYCDFFIGSVTAGLTALGLGAPPRGAAGAAADRHFVLHVPIAQLHDRRVPRPDDGHAVPVRLRPVRRVLPADGGRADRTGAGADAAAAITRGTLRYDQWPPRGCILILLGLVKKVAIADGIAAQRVGRVRRQSAPWVFRRRRPRRSCSRPKSIATSAGYS